MWNINEIPNSDYFPYIIVYETLLKILLKIKRNLEHR